MKKYLFLTAILFLVLSAYSQQKPKLKKYPSLFWEISGNGMKKPSYLFGTMHVSSKIAFNLSDSFYLAIRNCDVVALENNPESWQDDMSKLDYSSLQDGYGEDEYGSEEPDDYFTIQSLRINKYEKKLELALFSKPPVINNLLYRSLSEVTADFEEDTYLDLYIFQTGRRLGKRVAGVEQYEESMRLMNEAFRDAVKEKNKKEKSFEYDDEYSPDKLQDAYRSGNLDLLDSINRLNSQSDAFDEKFLYRRNEIQADGIDSILKKSTLFVGVGAAHLPGERGVIELLRQKGYKLRPIFMGSRDSKQKDAVEKIRVPVTFATQTADDGFFKVDIPGKLYRLGDYFFLDQQHYADMANGSFYMVTRVKTNSLFWGHSTDLVAKKLDSVLYENVPGKILSKTAITRNGYKGFDISSRTRRGDFNRYHIFITPYEVVFFRMSGNGEYVKDGDEAKKFFGSIQLREFNNEGWKKFQPAFGGFSIDFPHQPYESIGKNILYDAEDKTTGQHFSVIRTDIHNYNFAEEDSFDLKLMNESFASSEFIDKTISSRQFKYKGYPASDAKYRHKDGTWFHARFIIRGPHYYTLLSHGKNETSADADKFFNSFSFTPLIYKEQKERKDTTMGFTVNTTWFPEEKKQTIELPGRFSFYGDDEEENFLTAEDNEYKNRLIKNDTTGEAIYVTFSRWTKYEYIDSVAHSKDKSRFLPGYDTTWIIRSEKKSVLPNGMKILERLVTDSNSSRAIFFKKIYNSGISFILTTQTDTLSQLSSFVKNFFDNFTPADTLKGANPYVKKSTIFFEDFFSTDSILRKKAIAAVGSMRFDSTDLPMLVKAINSFKWSERNYLERKISFINELGGIPVKASADLLKDIYFNAGDTITLQHAALEALLKQQTQYAFNVFSNIITSEPPVLETGGGYTNTFNYRSPMLPYPSLQRSTTSISPGFFNGRFLDELYDSLKLTKTILPSLLPLMNIDDYEKPLMNLLRMMVDSNMVTAKDYEIYFSKFLIEAKQELKKQAIEEKKSSIDKAEDEKKTIKSFNAYRAEDIDQGNDDLITYATLLLPFRQNNPAVDDLLKKMLTSNDKRLKYNTSWLLMRHKTSLPDTMLSYFAKTDEYRYELFTDLKQLKMLDKFPATYKSHRDIAVSRLSTLSAYNKPDSLLYLDSLPVSLKKNKGFVYFYKYKLKKDDAFWKLAKVALLSPGGNIFNDLKNEEEDEIDSGYATSVVPGWNTSYSYTGASYAEFTDEKIKDDASLKKEMEKQVKKIVYTNRKSGRRFFVETPDYSDFNMQHFD